MNTILKIALLTAIPALALTSCGKDDDGMMPDNSKSITALVSENPNLSLLKVAVIRAGLAETLSAKGTFTVFAPDNAAFQAAGLGTEAAINAIAAEDLKKLFYTMPFPKSMHPVLFPLPQQS
ncbi:fasciclin domain-containing protein [Niabella hibiscisoli]|nr:fasciclin domain-containing protein [Niabella hibiscisoli]MCH5719466.1 fasciclin domain-containing protein [Niabella hibiscisoli]